MTAKLAPSAHHRQRQRGARRHVHRRAAACATPRKLSWSRTTVRMSTWCDRGDALERDAFIFLVWPGIYHTNVTDSLENAFTYRSPILVCDPAPSANSTVSTSRSLSASDGNSK